MKHILTTLVLLMFVSTNIVAKDMKVEALTTLKSDLETYKTATMKGDVDTLMGFIYPTIFTVSPKEQMTKMFKEMYASGKMPKISKMSFGKINEIQKFDKGHFTTVVYNMDMDMTLGELKPEMKSQMLEMLKTQMGPKSKVSLDDKTNTFHIEKESELIAIKEGKESWKFIEKTQVDSLVQAKLLPAQIIEKLK
ncbi:MAG: hypothetical protein L3J43_05500 [Sulfurovum sp.]|nr:hypothetical protein [Sulfurovum sp.]